MLRSIEDTAAGLGKAGRAWKRIFGPSSAAFDRLGEDIFEQIIRLPRHPLLLARFGVPALASAQGLARALPTPEARALFGGTAAHAFRPLSSPLSASVGMVLICACHHYGWPVARGGSGAIADALAASIARERGGRIETGRPVRSLEELPAADAVVLDLSPAAVAEIAGDRLPAPVARAYRRYRYGPGAFKVDLAVEGGVPWVDERSGRAGTVHAIGSFEEIVLAEREVNRGRMPERPFVLVGQQYLADPARTRDDVHPIWAYAHVPNGYPGRRDRGDPRPDRTLRARACGNGSAATATRSTEQLAEYNANYVGGDIMTGANTPLQTAGPARASRSIPTRPASPASTSARRRRRPGRAPTGCVG